VESLVVYPGFNAPVPDGVNDDHRLLRMPPLMIHQQLDFATSTMKTPKPVPYKRLKITSPETRTMQQQDDETAGPTTKQILQMIESRDTDVEKSETPAGKLVKVGAPVPVSYNVKKPPLEKWSENNSLSELIYFENLPNSTGSFDKMRSVLGGVRNKLFGSNPTTSGDKQEKGNEAEQPVHHQSDSDADTSVILLQSDETRGSCEDNESDENLTDAAEATAK
jgi:hypothetical protein